VNERPEISNNPPTANAGENHEVYVDETVIFNGIATASDGELTLFRWNFEGGWIITENPDTTHSFDMPGIYYVKFNVTDDAGASAEDVCIVIVRERDVPLNAPPSADAGENQEVYVNDTVVFDGTGTDTDGKITKFEWNFNGTWVETETGATTHTFDTPGTYFVKFRVTDSDGANGTDSCVILVHARETPSNAKPSASAGTDTRVQVDEEVIFHGTGTDPDGTIVLYEWDFDSDGEYEWSSIVNGLTTYEYDTPGTYTAALRVIDDRGASDVDFRIVIIEESEVIPEPENKQPAAEAGFEKSVFVIDSVIFQGKGTDTDGSIVLYEWDFDGDGLYNWSSTKNGFATHTYETTGIYFASLRVTDDGGAEDSDICIVQVTVKLQPPDDSDTDEDSTSTVVLEEKTDSASLMLGVGNILIVLVILLFIYTKLSKQKPPEVIVPEIKPVWFGG